MRIYGWLADYAGCAYYRLQTPLQALDEAADNMSTAASGVLTREEAEAADLVVGQRIHKEMSTIWWRQIIKPEQRVFEIDDDLWDVHPSSPAHRVFRDPVLQKRLTRNAETARAVTVSTEPLADVLRTMNPNVHVLPNYIDEALLEWRRPKRDQLVVGWAGSATHAVDFADAQAPLKRYFAKHPQVEFHLIGELGFAKGVADALRVNTTIMAWQPSVDDYHRSIDFDIGLAPLASNHFNDCKSAVKALEYAALGIPVVASDFGPYREFVRDGETGFLCRTDHDWFRALRTLTEDDELRDAMGKRAREYAAEHTIQKNAWRWAEAYEKIAA